jgi:drug/metabolite transporter (DMT)-like permease
MDDHSSYPLIPPFLALPVGIAAVSTASILIRFAQEYASSLTVAAFRLGLAAVILSPFVLLRYRVEIGSLKVREWKYALLSGGFLALHFATWITSLEYTTVASSVVLVCTSPLWVALLAPIFLDERISKVILVGIGLAFLGGSLVGLSDSCGWTMGWISCPPWAEFVRGEALLGDVLALVGAVCGACYLMVGRHLRAKMSLLPYIFLVYSVAAVGLIVAMLFIDGIPGVFPTRVYGWFILLAILPQIVGHSILNWALRYLSSAYVSLTLLGEPVGSTLLAYIFLGERPGALKIIGAILILMGILIASYRRRMPLTNAQNRSDRGQRQEKQGY